MFAFSVCIHTGDMTHEGPVVTGEANLVRAIEALVSTLPAGAAGETLDEKAAAAARLLADQMKAQIISFVEGREIAAAEAAARAGLQPFTLAESSNG